MTPDTGHTVPPALRSVCAALACPVCGEAVAVAASTLRCGSGHTFDVARQGYVNLLAGAAPANADTAAMIDARASFLATGHFAPVADAVASTLEGACQGVAGPLVDAGAGTGYHLARCLDAMPDRLGLALDISKFAARRAARTHERLASAVCDTWGRLPLQNGSVTALLSIFAPRNAAEFARVLAPGGITLVVSATPRHLAELAEPLGLMSVDPDKPERLARHFEPFFSMVADEPFDYRVTLTAEQMSALVLMGPNAHHRDAAALETAIDAIGAEADVSVSVRLTAFRARP